MIFRMNLSNFGTLFGSTPMTNEVEGSYKYQVLRLGRVVVGRKAMTCHANSGNLLNIFYDVGEGEGEKGGSNSLDF